MVMGVGNPLMRDEGIGPRVAEILMRSCVLDPPVEVVDAGTMGFTILDLIRGVDRLVIVDALDETGHAPGTVVLLTPEEIGENQVMHSLHDTRIVDVLQAAELLDRAPETTVVGMQIDRIEQWVLDLSEPCAEALPTAVAAVLELLAADGVSASPADGSDVDGRILEAIRSFAPMPTDDGDQSARD
jgi:hydrogenase maturation protease